MNKKLIPVLVMSLAIVLLTVPWAVAEVKMLPMSEFGISVKTKNLYAHKGKTAEGTVTNVDKARLGAGMTDARRGQRVQAKYMGDGFVEVTNSATGAKVTIEVRERVP